MPHIKISFDALKRGEKNVGYPKFKRKGIHDSFRADNGPQTSESNAVECVGKTIKLPRIGIVRMKEKLRFSGRTMSATIGRVTDGWYVSIKIV